jgi:hypothetical protein
VASVERKSLSDLVASLINGRLRFALAELAALPRAAVVVEDRYEHPTSAPPAPEPSTAEVRAWARSTGIDVTDRGRLRPEILQAWRDANRAQARELADQRGYQETPF